MPKLKNFLICLTGLPASGKSFFAKKLKEDLTCQQSNVSVKIIDPDLIRAAIQEEGFDPRKEKLVRKKNLELIRKYLKEGHVVISDDLNYYTSMRHDLKQIADDLKIKFIILHISTPVQTCVKWNEKRGRPIPDHLIHDIANKFDKFGKYQWDQPFQVLDLSTITDIDAFMRSFIPKLVEKVHEIREIEGISTLSSHSAHEKLDQKTRLLVGSILKQEKYKSHKNAILDFRKRFLKQYLDVPLEDFELEKEFKKQLHEFLNI
ncbi:MAG: AAA family ATPase [Promethearchaeota archaeon]